MMLYAKKNIKIVKKKKKKKCLNHFIQSDFQIKGYR